MKVFLMHIGAPGNIDLDYTVTQSRSLDEVLDKLPSDAPERGFFESNALASCFPSRKFNCWGVPVKAEPSFRKTNVGDLVLFAPEVGPGGGIEYIGIVKAICRTQCYDASRILWPKTPNERLFPWLFFFDTETGHLPWDRFLAELKIARNWNPRGWYRPIGVNRFIDWGGVEGYLKHLRVNSKFRYQSPEYGVVVSHSAPEIEQAVETISTIAGKRKSTSGQGFQISPKVRRAVEIKAMSLATNYFRELGWNVEDVSQYESFDLRCYRGEDELHVEVKGTTSVGTQVLLTPNEVEHARRYHPDTALFIAINLRVDNAPSDKPTVSGEEFKLIMPWLPIDENLKAVGFTYQVS
jgi:hypothetical protein